MKDILALEWIDFNAALQTCSEAMLRQALEREQKGRRREQYLKRLYGRYSKVRMLRERAELSQVIARAYKEQQNAGA